MEHDRNNKEEQSLNPGMQPEKKQKMAPQQHKQEAASMSSSALLLALPGDVFAVLLGHLGGKELMALEDSVHKNPLTKNLFLDRYLEIAKSGCCRRSQIPAGNPRARVKRFVRCSAFAHKVRTKLLEHIQDESKDRSDDNADAKSYQPSYKSFPSDGGDGNEDGFLLVTTSNGHIAFEGFTSMAPHGYYDYKVMVEDSPDTARLGQATAVGSSQCSSAIAAGFATRGQGVTVVLRVSHNSIELIRAASGLEVRNDHSGTYFHTHFDRKEAKGQFGEHTLQLCRGSDNRSTRVLCSGRRSPPCFL